MRNKMSTKNLARTVIERGRVGHNKYERRQSNKEQRATERAYLTEIRKDPEGFDECMLEERSPVSKEFNDHLRPMYRWLQAQVGREWSIVRSEVFQKFDTKTTAGRHITFDHLLSSVVETKSGWDKHGRFAEDHAYYSQRHPSFYVDENDTLCTGQQKAKYSYWSLPSKDELTLIAEQLAGRMIIMKEGKLHWFTPNEGLWRAAWLQDVKETKYGPQLGHILELRYQHWEIGSYEEVFTEPGHFMPYVIKRTGATWKTINNPYSFRQRQPLNKEEIKYFNSLNPRVQRDMLDHGKGR